MDNDKAQQVQDNLPVKTIARPAPTLAPWEDGRCAVSSTYDRDTKEGAIKIIRMMNSDALTSDEVAGGVIEIEHVIMHMVPIANDQTGEIEMKLRTVLIGPGDVAVQFVANGIVESLAVLSSFYGKPPWSPALKVEVVRKKCKVGHTFKLIPVGD